MRQTFEELIVWLVIGMLVGALIEGGGCLICWELHLHSMRSRSVRDIVSALAGAFVSGSVALHANLVS
jgi:hypothetical protein